MKLVVLSVRDRAVSAFGVPTFHVHPAGAIRAFRDEINRSSDTNMMFKHPEDFDLYQLGFWDDDEATFELFDRPKQLVIGKDAVTSPR